MLYMLDTSTVSDVIREPADPVSQRVRQEARTIAVSVIVAAELRFGCAKKRSSRLLHKIEAMLSTVPVLPFEASAALEYAAIRAQLERVGRPIGANDLLIAAHARALGATLVTANVDEFRRVHGLVVENWSS